MVTITNTWLGLGDDGDYALKKNNIDCRQETGSGQQFDVLTMAARGHCHLN